MPSVIKVADVQALFSVITGEPMGSVVEQRRYSRRELEKLAELYEAEATDAEIAGNLPVQEKGEAFAIAMMREFQRHPGDGYTDAYYPAAFAYDLVGLLTDAPSRRLSTARAWGLMVAPPVDAEACALDQCPITHAACFGAAVIRLLTDADVFADAREISVVGDRGTAVIEFSGDRYARFRVGLPLGPAFAPGRGIKRLRSIEVPKLRPIFDLLAAAFRPDLAEQVESEKGEPR
jgi:hypothetical protein